MIQLCSCVTEELHLGENLLSGAIPSEIGDCSKLSEWLSLPFINACTSTLL